MGIEYEINQFWHQAKERHELDKTDELEFKLQKQIVLAKYDEELRALKERHESDLVAQRWGVGIIAGSLCTIGILLIVALAPSLASSGVAL